MDSHNGNCVVNKYFAIRPSSGSRIVSRETIAADRQAFKPNSDSGDQRRPPPNHSIHMLVVVLVIADVIPVVAAATVFRLSSATKRWSAGCTGVN